jgi:hypothetical protein
LKYERIGRRLGNSLVPFGAGFKAGTSLLSFIDPICVDSLWYQRYERSTRSRYRYSGTAADIKVGVYEYLVFERGRSWSINANSYY